MPSKRAGNRMWLQREAAVIASQSLKKDRNGRDIWVAKKTDLISLTIPEARNLTPSHGKC